jgi:hypothetical protein
LSEGPPPDLVDSAVALGLVHDVSQVEGAARLPN